MKMNPKKQINLRGHHIRCLQNYYEFVSPLLKNDIASGIALNEFTKYTLHFRNRYGREFTDKMTSILANVSLEKGVPVKIVEGLDSICNLGCPRISDECVGFLAQEVDAGRLLMHGLKLGETYLSQDLMELLKK